jgi:hypothetical protein
MLRPHSYLEYSLCPPAAIIRNKHVPIACWAFVRRRGQTVIYCAVDRRLCIAPTLQNVKCTS